MHTGPKFHMICIIKLDIEGTDPISEWIIGNDIAEVLGKAEKTMPTIVAEIRRITKLQRGKYSLYDNYLMLVE